jgi:thiopeptide-type bacteriocin biosynthesis protein
VDARRASQEDVELKAFVFLGPSLPVETAKQYVDAEFLPPVQQGDVLRVLRDRPYAIGIVDGYFHSVPAVWHKEILTALAEGVHVLGAASMGALRAAELAPFGMTGLGAVFEKFRAGEYTDDDEVAVTHGPADGGFKRLSEAMVSIRDVCEAAARAQVLAATDAQILVRTAKALHYSQRRWEAILAQAKHEGMAAGAIDRLQCFRASYKQDIKERDAICLLQRLADLIGKPAKPFEAKWTVEQTVFLADLKREVAREAAPEVEEVSGTQLNVARKKVLLGLLASREVVRRGLVIGSADVGEMTQSFRGSYGLAEDEMFDAWRAKHTLAEPDFDYAMQRFTEVVRLEQDSRSEIDTELDNYLRVYSAAVENQQDTAEWLQLNIGLERGRQGAEEHARLLFGELLVELPKLRRSGGLESFHFVRKPPDVRMRFRAVDPGKSLLPRLHRLLSKVHGQGCIVSAYRSVYEPEARIFGGSASMAAVHEYFDSDSVNWIRWDRTPTDRRTLSAAQFCTAVMNDLLGRVLDCGNEVWDVWKSLLEQTRGSRTLNIAAVRGDETLAGVAGGVNAEERAVLRSYAAANRKLASALKAALAGGQLTIGMRALLPMVAMFHFNRFGLDGHRQASIAAAAARACHPRHETAVGQVHAGSRASQPYRRKYSRGLK